MTIPSGARTDANTVIAGSFTGAGQSSQPAQFYGPFAASAWGTFAGTVELQRSPDGGTTWIPASLDSAGAAADFSAPMTVQITEPEWGVVWRITCTAYSSGTINYRLSQIRIRP